MRCATAKKKMNIKIGDLKKEVCAIPNEYNDRKVAVWSKCGEFFPVTVGMAMDNGTRYRN